MEQLKGWTRPLNKGDRLKGHGSAAITNLCLLNFLVISANATKYTTNQIG